jgi:hypothetical protein
MRTLPWFLLVACALCAALADVGVSPAEAEEPAAEAAAPAEEAPTMPALAEAQELEEALERFKEDFKAKGLKGDDKLMQKDHAIRTLAAVPHPVIVDRLYEIARRDRASEVRRMALEALGQQAPLAAYAGPKVVALLGDKRMAKEDDHVLASLRAIGRLRFLPPIDTFEGLLRHKDYAIRKQTLVVLGELKDVRLLDEMLRALGSLEAQEQGESWDGAEATVDTGTAGDGDQKAAEAKAKADAARNAAGHRGRGGGGATRDLKDQLLASLAAMTGQDFVARQDAGTWLEANPDWRGKALGEVEAALQRQDELAKALGRVKK